MRRLLAWLLLVSAAAVPLAARAHEANYPLVLIPGWHGQGAGFNEMIPKLQAQGFTVLDFDPVAAGLKR